MKMIETEVKKDLANKNIKAATADEISNIAVRNTEIANMKTGDLVYLSKDLPFMSQTMTRARKDEKGNFPKAIFMKAPVYRDGKWVVVNFYPSSMWKSRQLAEQVDDPENEGKKKWVGITGEFRKASGSAAEDVQAYSSFKEFVEANDGKVIKITVSDPLDTMAFGDYQKTTISNFDWSELPAGVEIPE